MFNYLEYEDLLTINPIRRIRIRLKEAQVLPKALNKQEIEAILDEAYKAISIAPKTKYSYLEKGQECYCHRTSVLQRSPRFRDRQS